VFQAFLTTFLVDSGYKKPIQSKDEMYESGIKLYYQADYSFIFENGDETEALKVRRNLANCPSYTVCLEWARYHKNVSILFADVDAEVHNAEGNNLGENFELFICSLDDGVIFNSGLSMIMLQGDPLMRLVNEIIDHVVESGLFNCWISKAMNEYKVKAHRISLVHQLDEYYSFKLYHMQPAFYLLLIGLCLSVLCFMFELFYKSVLNKRK
jgi:hypothetical protein